MSSIRTWIGENHSHENKRKVFARGMKKSDGHQENKIKKKDGRKRKGKDRRQKGKEARE